MTTMGRHTIRQYVLLCYKIVNLMNQELMSLKTVLDRHRVEIQVYHLGFNFEQ